MVGRGRARAAVVSLALAIAYCVAGSGAASARAPAAGQVWGCLLTTKVPGFYTGREIGSGGSGFNYWGAAGKVGGCDRKRTLLITASLRKLTDGGESVLVDRFRHEIVIFPQSPHKAWNDQIYAVSTGNGFTTCSLDPTEWAVGPFFMRMVVTRKHHPGTVRLRSHVVETPCANPDFKGYYD